MAKTWPCSPLLDVVRGPVFSVEASAEGRINGLRWTLKLTASVVARTLETLVQTLVEEVEAGTEEDAGTIVKTTTIEGLPGCGYDDDDDDDNDDENKSLFGQRPRRGR